MSDLKSILGEAAGAAFAASGLPVALGRVTVSDRPDLADFQCNGALAAAKQAGRPPRDIATEIAARLAEHPAIEAVEIAGPGFINLKVTSAAIAARTAQVASEPLSGAAPVDPRRVIIDYGGPNVAKPMHVGHLRSSIIGESLKRLHRFVGDETWGDAHFGDWGFQMGLLILASMDHDPRLRMAVNIIDDGGDAAGAEAVFRQHVDLPLLEQLYPAAAARAKTEPEFRDLARKATAELQSGRASYRLMWRVFADVSRVALERDFHALGVDFDLWLGESDADPLIGEMITDLEAKGLLENDQGARIVRVARPGETKKKKLDDGSVVEVESPDPLLVVSSEGSAMYGTTDLATILQRRRDYDPDLILYCVDQRQADHFEQVFRAAAKAGYAPEGSLKHIGFGTMNGADGKPFKTREGGVLKLADLIGMAREKAVQRLHEAGLGEAFAPAEFDDIAMKVAIAALKFADLQNFRGTSYIFDLDRFTSFEGKTGPYLLYQAVRIKSLLRKAGNYGDTILNSPETPGRSPVNPEGIKYSVPVIQIAEPAERELGLTLDAFAAAVAEAYEKSAPHFIAEHAYSLAQAFAKFYAACPVLAAPDAATRGSRLALSRAALAQMETALQLLGIETPERM